MVGDHLRPALKRHGTVLDFLDIAGEQCQTMGGVAVEIGLDQPARGRQRRFFRHAGLGKDGYREGAEGDRRITIGHVLILNVSNHSFGRGSHSGLISASIPRNPFGHRRSLPRRRAAATRWDGLLSLH